MTAYNTLDEASIFVFRGHGDAGHISFGESSLYSYGSNFSNRYSLSTFGENALARLSMALYVGCSTGVKPQAGLSLQEVTFEKGAHFALGTFDTSITYHADAFVQQLVEHLLSGKSLKESIKKAQTYFDDNDIDIPLYHYHRSTQNYPIIYTGDIYQKIK